MADALVLEGALQQEAGELVVKVRLVLEHLRAALKSRGTQGTARTCTSCIKYASSLSSVITDRQLTAYARIVCWSLSDTQEPAPANRVGESSVEQIQGVLRLQCGPNAQQIRNLPGLSRPFAVAGQTSLAASYEL